MPHPIVGHVVFACGARIAAREYPSTCRVAKDGRLVVCVYDSDSPRISRPKTVIQPSGAPDDDGDVIVAPCVNGCRFKRAAARKLVRAFHEDGRGPGRVLVTCHGEWVPGVEENREPLTDITGCDV